MIEINIPGFKNLKLSHLIIDYNGTMALDGELIDGVSERIQILSERLTVHVLTADAHGQCASKLKDRPVHLHILDENPEDAAKLHYLQSLGADHVAAVGAGANDASMLKAAALGIAVIGGEGAAGSSVCSADVVVTDINLGLDLLIKSSRITTTLRR